MNKTTFVNKKRSKTGMSEMADIVYIYVPLDQEKIF